MLELWYTVYMLMVGGPRPSCASCVRRVRQLCVSRAPAVYVVCASGVCRMRQLCVSCAPTISAAHQLHIPRVAAVSLESDCAPCASATSRVRQLCFYRPSLAPAVCRSSAGSMLLAPTVPRTFHLPPFPPRPPHCYLPIFPACTRYTFRIV